MFFKIRANGSVETRAVYNILGVDIEGKKEVLGLYLSENEGAKFWLSILTDLKKRGVNDIIIACIDGLKSFPEAIEAVFPQTKIQLCIVHQIRSSMKYVAEKDKKAVVTDLKPIYTAINEEQGYQRLLEFEENGKDVPFKL
jgi:transposase-like protein